MRKFVILTDQTHTGTTINRFFKAPSGLRLAHQLRKKGIEVKTVFNFLSFSYEEFDEIMKSFTNSGKDEVVVGFSTSFLLPGLDNVNITENENGDMINTKFNMNLTENRKFLWGDALEKILKFAFLARTKYKAITIIGGFFIKKLEHRNFYFLNKVIDYFIIGDGTEVIYNLCINKSNQIEEYKGVKLINAVPTTNFEDQSSAPIIEDYINQGEVLSIELSNGCIFNCSFCSFGMLGKKKNEFMRTEESLYREIKHNFDNFGTRVYMVCDSIMNDNLEKLQMLSRIRDKLGVDLRWFGYARLDTINNIEHVQLLKDSGVGGLFFGIESMTKSVGPSIGKMTDGERIKDHLRLCRSVLKDTAIMQGGFISGLPTETLENIDETGEFINSAEGVDLLDSISYSRLAFVGYLEKYIVDKNKILYIGSASLKEHEIVKSRLKHKDHFLDYKVQSTHSWENSHGTSNQFSERASKIAFNNKRPIFLKEPIYAPFFMPSKVNVLDVPIEDFIIDGRKQKPIDVKEYIKKEQIKKNEYKSKVMNGL